MVRREQYTPGTTAQILSPPDEPCLDPPRFHLEYHLGSSYLDQRRLQCARLRTPSPPTGERRQRYLRPPSPRSPCLGETRVHRYTHRSGLGPLQRPQTLLTTAYGRGDLPQCSAILEWRYL